MNSTSFYSALLGINKNLFECINYSNLRYIFAHLSNKQRAVSV